MNTKSKKTVLGFIAVSAIAALAAINVSINSKETGLSDISLANVEALAVETDPLDPPGICNNEIWFEPTPYCCGLIKHCDPNGATCC